MSKSVGMSESIREKTTYQTMRVVVSINEFAYYLKVCSLPHVHGLIDHATETFRRDKCPHTFMTDAQERNVNTYHVLLFQFFAHVLVNVPGLYEFMDCDDTYAGGNIF